MNTTSVKKKSTNARSKTTREALPPYSSEPGKIPDCVLAIDQSSTRAGFAVVNSRGDILHLGSLSFSTKMTHKMVRAEIVWEVKRLIDVYHPVLIVLEHVDEYRMKKNAAGVWKKIHNTDVIRCFHRIVAALIDNIELPVYTVPTNAFKAAVFKTSRIGKEGAAQQVSLLYGKPVNHDMADAWGLAACCFCRSVTLHKEE